MQQSKLFCPKLSSDKRDPGDIGPRPVETSDEAELNRVPPLAKTIGIVVVAALATIDEGVSCAAITVT